MPRLIEIKDLHIRFHIHESHLDVVRGIDFNINRGETVALVGESGSGKSVTAQAILGILPSIAEISSGSIHLHDPSDSKPAMDLASLDPSGMEMRSIRGGRISMIFQEPMVSLSPVHTIGDQVSEALFLHRDCDRQEGMLLTEEMLGRVGFPRPRQALKTYPFELSGGLRQRAMIAMALVCSPDLLIADEPTTALDVTIQAQILKLIKDLQSELDMAVLLITHDLGVVANMADKVVVMYHGEIMERGNVQRIFAQPGHVYLKALFKAVPHFNMKQGERLKPIREIIVELDESSTADAGPSAATADATILKVENLFRSFRNRRQRLFGSVEEEIKAVDDVSFSIKRGECFGLVGESGCGKTTLSKLLMRALVPDSGRIYFELNGKLVDLSDIHGQSRTDFRKKLQFIFQDPYSSLSPRMTVFDIIREPLQIHNQGGESEQTQWVQELMRRVGLDPRYLNRYPHSFSGGQRQRIGIARALALNPEMIICDEPVSALDVSIQAQILNLLKDLMQKLGLTYMFVSHNLAVVDYIADRIAVMCRGRLVEIAAKEDLFRNPVHPYTRALMAAVPYPELDHPLDFKLIMESQLSDPGLWPSPFAVTNDNPGKLEEISPGHFVRQSTGSGNAGIAA